MVSCAVAGIVSSHSTAGTPLVGAGVTVPLVIHPFDDRRGAEKRARLHRSSRARGSDLAPNPTRPLARRGLVAGRRWGRNRTQIS
jgi:hypothetical protein